MVKRYDIFNEVDIWLWCCSQPKNGILNEFKWTQQFRSLVRAPFCAGVGEEHRPVYIKFSHMIGFSFHLLWACVTCHCSHGRPVQWPHIVWWITAMMTFHGVHKLYPEYGNNKRKMVGKYRPLWHLQCVNHHHEVEDDSQAGNIAAVFGRHRGSE